MIGLLAIWRTLLRGLRSFAADAQARALLLLSLGVISGGAFFYRQVEALSWLDSLYLTIITLTTVGYGDLSSQTAAGKVFTMLYLLIGIGIIVALAGEVAAHLLRNGRRADGDGTPEDR